MDGSRGLTLTFDMKWVPRRCSSELEHKSLILVRVLCMSLSRLGRVKHLTAVPSVHMRSDDILSKEEIYTFKLPNVERFDTGGDKHL